MAKHEQGWTDNEPSVPGFYWARDASTGDAYVLELDEYGEWWRSGVEYPVALDNYKRPVEFYLPRMEAPGSQCAICGHPQHDTVCNRAMWTSSCDCPGEQWAAAWAETVRPNAEAAREQDRLRQEERICSCGATIVHVKDEFWRRKENGEVSTGGHYHAPAKAEQ